MDGNGRWGEKNKNSRNAGHKEGIVTVEKIIAESIKKKINYLTLFAFSTENWKRPQKEIKFLFNLLEYYLRNKSDSFNKQNIRFRVIGSKKISPKLKSLINSTEKKTAKNSGLQLILALNYGSKTEILEAFKKLKKNKKKITLDNFSKYLQTKNIPDPDILITHNEIHAPLIADRFTFLSLGEVIGSGLSSELGNEDVKRLMAGGAKIGDLAKELEL